MPIYEFDGGAPVITNTVPTVRRDVQVGSNPSTIEKQKRHLARIRDRLIEMRRCLRKSEEAHDIHRAIVAAYKDKGLDRGSVAAAMDNNFDAKIAIADSQLYDRWTAKYAAVVAAEIEAYRLGVHADDWEGVI